MANLLSWGKKAVKKVENDASKVYDQLNPIDNGRTFTQRTPTNNQSFAQQVTHTAGNVANDAGDVVKAVAPPAFKAVQAVTAAASPITAPLTHPQELGKLVGNVAARIPTLSKTNPITNAANKLVITPIKTTDAHVSQILQGHNPYKGSVKQQIGQATQDAINAASVLPVGKAADVALKGGAILPKIIEGAKIGGQAGTAFGLAQGASTSLKNNENLHNSAGTVLKDAAITGAGGTLIGGATGGIGGAVTKIPGVASRTTPDLPVAEEAPAPKVAPSVPTPTPTPSLPSRQQPVPQSSAPLPKPTQPIVSKNASSPPSIPSTAQPVNSVPSRFANLTVQNSDQVSPLTKELLAERTVDYNPADTPTGQAAADAYVASKPLDKVTSEVMSKLQPRNDQYGGITRQDAFNAQATAAKLNAMGTPEDSARAADIYAELSRHHTAAGQLNQAAAALAKQSPEGLAYQAQKQLIASKVEITPELQQKIGDAIDEYKQAQDAVKGAPAGANKRDLVDQQAIAYQKFINTVNNSIPRSKQETVSSFWRAGLLTGPETASKVGVSHAITAPVELSARPVTAGVDKLVSAAPNKALEFLNRNNRGYTAGNRTSTFNPLEDAKNFIKGSARGYKAGVLKTRTGIDLPNTGGFESGLGKNAKQTLYEKLPFRLHGSIMKPNYAGAFETELGNQARTQAINAGLKGADRKAYIDKFMADPSAEVQDIANKYAEKFTNMNATGLGEIASKLQGAKIGTFPLGKYLVPFTRIPSAIASKGIVDWTPLGLGKAGTNMLKGITKGNFDQAAFSQAVGRSLAGTTLTTATGYELMKSGRMTLAAPNDKKERALWEAEGKNPNSIKIGNKWFSLNAFGPAGISMGLGGAFARSEQQGGSFVANIASSIGSAGKLVADQPYFKGIAGMANALNDPTRYATTFLNSTVGSVIPAASSQTARGSDPLQRRYPTNIPDTFKSEIPGLREQLAPQNDLFGKNLPGPGGTPSKDAIGIVNPFYTQNARNTNDPVTKELQRLYDTQGSGDSPAISEPLKSQTINGKKQTLTPQQLHDYIAGEGPKVQQGVANLLKNPDYQKMNDGDKVTAINKIITASKQAQSITQLGNKPKSVSAEAKAAINDPKSLGTLINASTDPKEKYKQDIDNYNKGVKDGSISLVEQSIKQPALKKEAITSNYSKDVTALYGQSAAKIKSYLQGNPDQKLGSNLLALDQQLYKAGLISKPKLSGSGNTITGSGSSSSGSKSKKTAKADIFQIPKLNNSAITSAGAINKLLASSTVKAKKVSATKPKLTRKA